MECRYAIKIDDKGMANNSSTIILCLGLYLPTITSVGVLTGDEFRKDIHSTKIKNKKSFPDLYQGAIIAPRKEYKEEKKGVVEPIAFTHKEIIEILNETSEQYRNRLQAICKIREDKVFDVEEAIRKFDELIIQPGVSAKMPISISEKSPLEGRWVQLISVKSCNMELRK